MSVASNFITIMKVWQKKMYTIKNAVSNTALYIHLYSFKKKECNKSNFIINCLQFIGR